MHAYPASGEMQITGMLKFLEHGGGFIGSQTVYTTLRKPDRLYNANVLLESFVWVDQNTYYSVQVDANGNVALGSTTNKYTTEGYTITNIQAGEATSNGYPGRRWLSVMYFGNVPNRDMDTITYAGQTSVARTVNGTYAADPFDVTRYDYGFASAIPVGSVQNIYF